MKLILKGHTLTFEGTLPAQYSANVPVEFVNDDQYEEYTPSVNLRFYCHGKQYDTSIVIKDDVFLLPQQFFYACGKAYISILNKKDNVEVNSYPLALDVVHSVNAGAALDQEVTWREFVKNYVDECVADIEVSGGSGTTDYEELNNKPSINDVELAGNKTGKELGLVDEATYKALEEIVAKKLNDVLVGENSIVDENGVANIPIANSGTNGRVGLVKTETYLGLNLDSKTGNLSLYKTMNSHVDERNSSAFAINTTNYDRAVKNHLTDGKATEYTQEEKANARSRLGCEWRYIGKVETQEDVARMEMSLDSEGKPFNLRKVRVKIVNYPNASDLNTKIRLCFNDKTQDVFHNSEMMMGVKSAETMRMCDVVVEKIGNHLFPTSMYASINSTNTSTVLTPNVQYAYQGDCNEIDGYINQVYIYTWTNAIGANSIMEIWGVDA